MDEWHPFITALGETKPDLHQLVVEDKKQFIIKPTSSTCYERDEWRPFMTKHDEHVICSNRFEKVAGHEWKNKKHGHQAWFVVGRRILSSYHNEGNKRLSNKWRPFKIGHCDFAHIDQHFFKGQTIEWEDEIQSRFGQFEDQDNGDRTITDALDLATMPTVVTLATQRPLNRFKRWTSQSTPTHINLIAYHKQFSSEWQTLTTKRNIHYLYRLEEIDGKQKKNKPAQGWCYEWDKWRLFVTKHGEPVDCPHWFKEEIKYGWENKNHKHKTWSVIDFRALNSYHTEDDSLFANECRSFMMEHDKPVQTDLHCVKNKKNEGEDDRIFTIDLCEEQNNSDRTIIDALDLAITSKAITCPLERIEERWTFQSMPMYKNLILYGKQFSWEWQSFMMKCDKFTPDFNRLDKVDEIQDDNEKPSLIFYRGEDVKSFSDEWWPFAMEQNETMDGPHQFKMELENEWRNKKQNEIDLEWDQSQDEQEYKWYSDGWRRQSFKKKRGAPNYYDLNRIVEEDEDKDEWESETKSLSSWRLDQNGGDGTITDALDLATIPMGDQLTMLCPLELIEDRWMFQSMPMHINLTIYGKQFSAEFRPFYEPKLDQLQAEKGKKKEKDEKQNDNESWSISRWQNYSDYKTITLKTIVDSVDSGDGKKSRRSMSKRTNTIARGLKAVLRNVIF